MEDCRLTNRCTGRLTRWLIFLSQNHPSPQTPVNSSVRNVRSYGRITASKLFVEFENYMPEIMKSNAAIISDRC